MILKSVDKKQEDELKAINEHLEAEKISKEKKKKFFQKLFNLPADKDIEDDEFDEHTK